MALLQVALLGDLQMRSATGSLFTISAKKSQALMAYLAVKPSQRISREKIATFLWSSTGPDQARQSLRQTLSTLRKELSNVSPDEKILVEEGDLLGLDETLVDCDVAKFESLVAANTEAALAESMHRTLMRLYMQSGDVVNALQQYETCARILKRELRIDPDAETKALQREIVQLRERQTAAATPSDQKKTVLVVEDNVLNRE